MYEGNCLDARNPVGPRSGNSMSDSFDVFRRHPQATIICTPLRYGCWSLILPNKTCILDPKSG